MMAYFFLKKNSMRPSVDVHYRPESLEDTNLVFVLQKPRGLLTENLLADVDTYVNDPNFCKLQTPHQNKDNNN